MGRSVVHVGRDGRKATVEPPTLKAPRLDGVCMSVLVVSPRHSVADGWLVASHRASDGWGRVV